uniref:Transmembrane protein n=1 Tax=Caenorhabditis tropicalis TaxID=1561998 RepID=A0A1I7TS82_9PELO
MSQANHLSYSARMRGRSKQPIYSSDKRAKFTQKSSHKWIKFITVLGYILSVSLPAISLSVYYIYIWDPGYITKYPADPVNKTVTIHKTPILSQRIIERDIVPLITTIEDKVEETKKIDLASILQDGLKSMESKERTSSDNG